MKRARQSGPFSFADDNGFRIVAVIDRLGPLLQIDLDHRDDRVSQEQAHYPEQRDDQCLSGAKSVARFATIGTIR